MLTTYNQTKRVNIHFYGVIDICETITKVETQTYSAVLRCDPQGQMNASFASLASAPRTPCEGDGYPLCRRAVPAWQRRAPFGYSRIGLVAPLHMGEGDPAGLFNEI